MARTIIGLSGPSGAGKTYAAHLIRDALKNRGFFVIDSFAAPLKAFVMDLSGTKLPMNKEAPYPLYPGMTYREILQQIGTDVMREKLDKEIWIRSLETRNEHNYNIVIDDVRFENEADWIRSQGGIVVRIVPQEGSVVKGEVWRSHESEKGLVFPDKVVTNRFDDTFLPELINALVFALPAPSLVPPIASGRIEHLVHSWMQNFKVFEGKSAEQNVMMYEKLLREELNELSMENVGTENFYREVFDVLWVALGLALASGMSADVIRKGMFNLHLSNSMKCCSLKADAEKYALENGGENIVTTLEGNYMVLNRDGKIMKGPFHRKMNLPDELLQRQ